MNATREGAAIVPLPDGDVLVAGGRFGVGQFNDSFETYQPSTDSFSAAEPMNPGRYGAAAAPLPDGRVLIAGGAVQVGGILSSAVIFDPATQSFDPTGDMLGPR